MNIIIGWIIVYLIIGCGFCYQQHKEETTTAPYWFLLLGWPGILFYYWFLE